MCVFFNIGYLQNMTSHQKTLPLNLIILVINNAIKELEDFLVRFKTMGVSVIFPLWNYDSRIVNMDFLTSKL